MGKTVITLRSAKAFRDAGIRYGLYRTMFVGSAILMAFGVIPFGIGVFMGTDSLIKLSVVLEGIPLVVMILSNGMMEYPHSPEITKEDIDGMHDLGIPEPVIHRTLDVSLPVIMEKEMEASPDA